MATPRVFGHELRLTANLCLARDASVISISIPNFPYPLLSIDSQKRTQERFVGSSSTSNNTNHSTGAALDDLLGTRWELDTGLALLRVVSDNSNVVSGGTSQRTTVTCLLLNVGDNGTFWNRSEREDVSDCEVGVLSSVDELTGVHSLVGDESLGVELESVWIAENDLGEGSTTSWVVNDVLYDTTDVAVSLSIIESSELSGCLVQSGVGREDRAAALSLVTDDSLILPNVSHGSANLRNVVVNAID